MSTEQNKEERIYTEALSKTPQERLAYIEKACGNDKELLERVKALLKSREDAGSFLDGALFDADVTLDQSPLTEGPGTVIGRYKLLEKIGEGGMASVYMAEQKQPIRRRVALKIIKLGMDTKQVIARFEAERQALAMMDHPNIAQVFDAGTTETGRPYFVMELVRGVPITEFCDKNNLNMQERLDLFISLCNAIQHAHQKGIIHRDIKPSNIMVTLHDGEPVVKVIDFGIAKAINQQLTEKTVFTRYSQMIGTPEYMSPEQAEMSGLDIDTRTDVFSLGVMLYELLTGTTPFDSEYLLKKGYGEMQRIIREEEPLRPSTKVSTLGETLTDIARRRKTSPQLLTKMIRSDLDWIVMKTLEKDRNRRYESVSELSADIKRHLNNESVLAGRPSTFYRAQKFVKRNKLLVTSSVVIIVILVISTTFSYSKMVQADKKEKEAKQNEKKAIEANEKLEQTFNELNVEKTKAEQSATKAIQQSAIAKAKEFLARRLAYVSNTRIGYQYLIENNYIQLLENLKNQIPEPGKEDLRDISYRYLWWLSRPDNIPPFYSGKRCSVAFSPEGKYLAEAGSDNVLIRDLKSGGKPKSLPGGTSVCFTPKGEYMITDGYPIRIYETSTWKQVIALKDCGFPWALSPEGDTLVVKKGNKCQIININPENHDANEGGFCRMIIEGDYSSWILKHAIVFSPDGKLLLIPEVSSGRFLFRVLEFPSLKPITDLRGSIGWTAAFLPDNKHLLVAAGNKINVYDIESRKNIKTLKKHTMEITAIVPALDGKTFYTASHDSAIIIWDALTFEPIRSLLGHISGIYDLAVSSDGKMLASCSWEGDNTVTGLWNPDKDDEFHEIDGADMVLGFINNNQILVAMTSQGVILKDTVTNKTRKIRIPAISRILSNLRNGVNDGLPVTINESKGVLLLGTKEGNLELWDLMKESQESAWSVSINKAVNSVGISADGNLWAVATHGGEVTIWDAAKRSKIDEFRYDFNINFIWSLVFSRDNKYLAVSGNSRSVFVLNIEESLTKEFTATTDWVFWVSFSPDGHQLAASIIQNSQTCLWNIDSKDPLAVFPGFAATFTPDGKSLATIFGDTVKMYDLATLQEIAVIHHKELVSSIAFSSNSNIFAAGFVSEDSQKSCVRFWQIPTLEEIDATEASSQSKDMK